MFTWTYFLHVLLIHLVVFSDNKLVQRNGIKCFSKTCNKNQTFKHCETDLGQDECINCPLDHFSCEVIDTASEEAAYLVRTDMLNGICVKYPTCLLGSVLRTGDICQYMETDDYCECDRENLFYGKDWRTCTVIKSVPLLSHIQQRGNELKQDGTVGPCNEGFYKDKEDLSTCQRWTQCAHDNIKTLGTKTTDTICKNVTDLVVSAGSESTNSGDIPKAILIAAVIAGVFVLAVIVLISITIYLRCGSQISEFFKHINIRSPDHTLPIAETSALQDPLTSANDGNQGASDNEQLQASQSSQFSLCHNNDKEEICTEQTFLKSETECKDIHTDMLPNTMQDSENLTWGNCSAHNKQDKEWNTSSHCHQSLGNQNISTASSSSDGFSSHDKPTARVTPFKQENTMEEPQVPNNTDSLRLTSAPPLDSLLT